MFLNGLRATEWSRRQAGVGRCQMPKSNVGCFPCRHSPFPKGDRDWEADGQRRRRH